MSEQINNRQYRQNVIKELIRELHEGKTVDEVKHKFEQAFAGVSATEISEAEQALINEGLPVEEVQRLCDVHAAVFKGSIEEIHASIDVSEIPGHPANVLKVENMYIDVLIDSKLMPVLVNKSDPNFRKNLDEALKELYQVDIHYAKKENLLFPYLEKYGVTAPPQVMWGVDDEIRDEIKDLRREIQSDKSDVEDIVERGMELAEKIKDMIFKEENILLPMLVDMLTEDEWKQINEDSFEYGNLVDNIPEWNPTGERKKVLKAEESEPDSVTLSTGVLKKNELEALLNALPFDITFVDKNGLVKYFSQSAERIFARTTTVLGRHVTNCHPPTSVHVVTQIVEDLESGKKDHEDFWIRMGDKYVFIRYFAVRDNDNNFLGVLEVTQNIAPIQEITGEKRLMS
ncbi:MAG TPA: DUF438 domain-containing protein [Clostridiaceae bacterium]|jgi:DUF438 domain-containing protein|nr:DUF438 domain-containing protein [Clostridiaceae bacterium]